MWLSKTVKATQIYVHGFYFPWLPIIPNFLLTKTPNFPNNLVWSWSIEKTWVIPRKQNFDLRKKLRQEKSTEEVFHPRQKKLTHEKKNRPTWKNFGPREKISTRRKNFFPREKISTNEIIVLTHKKRNWSMRARTYKNMRSTRPAGARDPRNLRDS